jgi:hypothetical protein
MFRDVMILILVALVSQVQLRYPTKEIGFIDREIEENVKYIQEEGILKQRMRCSNIIARTFFCNPVSHFMKSVRWCTTANISRK